MTSNSSVFERSKLHLDLPTNKPTYMIAIPRCHENLFSHIKKNHEWLSSSGTSHEGGREDIFLKKIATEEDMDRLEKLIRDLRLEKSEILIDDSYHPKPYHTRIQDYVQDYLRNKSVHTYYTFKSYYRITVFPLGTDILAPTKEQIELRNEYLIIPLYIILKRGKTYDQMKVIENIGNGEFIVKQVNPNHFCKLHDNKEDQEIIDEKNAKMREKVVNSLS